MRGLYSQIPQPRSEAEVAKLNGPPDWSLQVQEGCAGMPQSCVRFDEFELDTESCELLRAGQRVKLERIPMQLLVLLLENRGKLVRREAIIERLWAGNVFVEAEHSINTAVNKLRAILRDDSRNPQFIRTVVGQGYCFIAAVNVPEPGTNGYSRASSGPAELNGTNHDTNLIAGNGHANGSSMVDGPKDQLASEQSGVSEASAVTVAAGASAKEALTQTIKRPSDSKLWIIGALAGSVAVVITLGFYLMRQHQEAPKSQQEPVALRSVAVLPFRNLAQTSNEDYLVDGLTDELTTILARNTSLRVISQRSAMRYKEGQYSIQEIARSLNVDAVVEGSYLHADKRVRITVQLIDARNDQHLWAQMYDESDKHLFAMQNQVTKDIAQQIAIVLGSRFTRSQPGL
jgi:TolB-like protein/DNA-binding winged helix-turn-helix (wHTH) protein